MSEIILFAGITFSVIAVWLQWNLQHRFSHLEERYKDGRMTGDKLARAMRCSRMKPIWFTFLGACLLIIAASRYFG